MDAQSNNTNQESNKVKKELSPEKRRLARKRWELLINALTSKKCDVEPSVSVRRFDSFGLLKTEAIDHDTELMTNSITGQQIERRHIWYKYTCKEFPKFVAVIRHLDGALDISDVLGFNNTGNVCVWPSEEVLAYYCLKHAEMFQGKNVCEIGGGMTCLAGLAVALCTKADEVLLTDGNQTSIDNVNQIIARNKSSLEGTTVAASLLRWDDVLPCVHSRYDIVICADCLFFDEYRLDLVNAIDKVLKPGGKVIMFAPSRGRTFQQFKELLPERFVSVVQQQQYDDVVWNMHLQNVNRGLTCYAPDLHYPIMLTFNKPSATS